MPQPSLINGVAGTVHTEAYQGPGPGEQMVAMAEAFTRVKQAQQASAQQKLKIMLDNVDKLPIDDKAIRKVAKQAGLPLGSDDHIAAIAAAGKQAKQEKAGAPANAGSPASSKPAETPDAAAAKAHAEFQKNMTPQQAKSMVFESWAAKARQMSAAKQDSEIAKANLETKLTTLKTRAADGDGKAAGQLMSVAEIPFNVSQLAWQNATPEAKTKMYDIALGHETEAQQHERSDGIAKNLMAQGHSAADAYSLANTISSGGTLSAEQQKKMGAPTFEMLGKQADYIHTLQDLGVPSDQVQSVATQAAITGNLVGALPKGLQSVASQQLALKQREVKTEEARTAIAGRAEKNTEKREELDDRRVTALEKATDNKILVNKQKNENTVLKLRLMENTGENKQVLDAMKAVIMAKKSGVTVDPKELQKVMDQMKSLQITDDPASLIEHLSGTGSPAVGGDPVADELGAPKK